MFSYADQDCDGKISWQEFQTMINPPKPPEPPKPTLADLAVKVSAEKPQTLSVSKIMSESISISSNFPENMTRLDIAQFREIVGNPKRKIFKWIE